MPSSSGSHHRIRDAVHDLIVFDLQDRNSVDGVCWNILQSMPFQRLRRIKQLGFSEFVYPGATHSRFTHSVGVFHTAKRIRKIIDQISGDKKDTVSGSAATVAALVHDLGHGPFSHAFEEALKEIGIKKSHERWTLEIIRSDLIAPLIEEFDPQFIQAVERTFSDKEKNIYGSIVSSQFDADRLDYMRRDRMMTGTQHGALDLSWLLANLDVRSVNVGIDDAQPQKQQVLVIGPKAVPAAEAYILGLFQLYQTVYLHKTTCGMELLFTAFLVRLAKLVRDGNGAWAAIASNHPLLNFLYRPDSLESYLRLDDAVIWGALAMARDARDPVCAELAIRILDRKIYKPLDVSGPISAAVRHRFGGLHSEPAVLARDSRVAKFKELVAELVMESKGDDVPTVLQNVADRNPYKRRKDAKSGLDTIWVSDSGREVRDLVELSDVVRALRPFSEYRVYTRDEPMRHKLDEALKKTLLEISQ